MTGFLLLLLAFSNTNRVIKEDWLRWQSVSEVGGKPFHVEWLPSTETEAGAILKCWRNGKEASVTRAEWVGKIKTEDEQGQ